MRTRQSDPKPPEDPLLYVPSHPARELEEDVDAAGIPKWTDDGKVYFHACRVAYITLLLEGGADVKTAQALARHCDPRITVNVYARSRRETLAKATEALGEEVLTSAQDEELNTGRTGHVEIAAGLAAPWDGRNREGPRSLACRAATTVSVHRVRSHRPRPDHGPSDAAGRISAHAH